MDKDPEPGFTRELVSFEAIEMKLDLENLDYESFDGAKTVYDLIQ